MKAAGARPQSVMRHTIGQKKIPLELSMDITQKDLDETSEMAELLKKIDNIDENYVNRVSDEIFQRQPFFLSVFLGYRHDVSPEELDEIMKMYFLIWEYFRRHKNVQTKQITQTDFEKIQRRNIQMLHYADGELDQKAKAQVYTSDLQNLRSKALLTAILFMNNNRPVLLNMDPEKKATIYVGTKTFIECFERL